MTILFLAVAMGEAKKSRFSKAVAEKVASMRREKGLSQAQLATLLEVTRGFIGQVESPNSASVYSVDQLNRIAFELGCTIYELLPQMPLKEKHWDL